jgi:hypothetical protein
MRSKTAVIIICVLASLASGQALPEWRKLVPLVSTKEDVEKVLGPPNQWNLYRNDKGVFVVNYSNGTCDDHTRNLPVWNVKRGTLTSLLFILKDSTSDDSIPPEVYESKLETFARKRRDDSTGFDYTSSDGSIVIQTVIRPKIGERVKSVTLRPRKDQNNLRGCRLASVLN